MEEIWQRARQLRNAATDAECHLWQHLRGRRLQGLKFRRQYPIAGSSRISPVSRRSWWSNSTAGITVIECNMTRNGRGRWK